MSTNQVARILYEVSATVKEERIEDAWIRWILDEHVGDVVAAGALSGRLIRIEGGSPHFVVQYEFADRSALDAYLLHQAPRLREIGAARFTPTQISYQRRIGLIIEKG